MIDGFDIGHHTADGDGWLSGTTVVVARNGAVGGVDVRGGGPGTRETDLLDPSTLVQHVHAIVLTGGSAYGLAAADGVMRGLEARGIGFPVSAGQVVPIVPAAVIFDLGRGGDFGHRPDASFGALALAAATADRPQSGSVGAGTGAVSGGLKGGFGYAERSVGEQGSMAAAVVVNTTGSAVDPHTGRLWADDRGRLGTPSTTERQALAAASAAHQPPVATTIGVVLTDVELSKAQARRVAMVGHDGLARAVRPIHALTDGDTLFCLSSSLRPGPAAAGGSELAQAGPMNELLAAAADLVAEACLDAILSATGRNGWRSYRELVPSAVDG